MKKLLAVVLTVLMIVTQISVLSTTAFANENNGDYNNGSSESSVGIEPSGGLGSLIANSLAEQEEAEIEEDIQNKILDVTISDNFAAISFNNNIDCTIIVAIYEETTKKLVCSGLDSFEPNTRLAEIELAIETMPEYFIVKAFMLDSENRPLCNSHENIEYTCAYQEFLATTVNDFDEDVLVNFDESEDNNFAALKETTVAINGTNDINTLIDANDQAKVYTFNNANSKLLNLAIDDAFYYTYGEGVCVAGKVKSITINRNTVTIVGQDDVALDDIFEFVKIDTTANGAGAEIDMSGSDEEVEYLGEFEQPSTYAFGDINNTTIVSHQWKVEKEFKKSDASSSSVKFKLSTGLSISSNIKAHVFLDYCSVELILEEKSTHEFSISGELAAEFDIAEINLPTGIGDLTIVVDINFVVEGEVSVSTTVVETSTVGYRFDSRYGKAENLSVPSNTEAEIAIEGKIFVGLKIKASVKVLAGIIEAGAYATIGVEFSGEPKSASHSGAEIHKCDFCVEGKAEGKFSVGVNIAIKIKVIRLDISKSFELCALNFPLYDYHIANGKLGFGKCPNNQYQVTFYVVNEDGIAIEGVSFGDAKTNQYGYAYKYYPAGEQEELATKSGYDSKVARFNVTRPLTTKVTMRQVDEAKKQNSNVAYQNYGTIESTGKCGDTAYYTLYKDGTMIVSGTGTIESNIPFPIHLKIKRLIITEGIKNIYGEFYYCQNLISVQLPNSLFLMANAFRNCTSLESIVIPEGVVAVVNNSFSGCSSLKSVSLPKSIVNIYNYAFADCTSLKSIYYAGSKSQWNNIGRDSTNSFSGASVYYNYKVSGNSLYLGRSVVQTYNSSADDLGEVDDGMLSISGNDLVPGENYALLAVLESADECTITTDTLLYITDAVADEDGIAEFNYYAETEEPYVVLICGKCNHSSTVWTESTAPTCVDQGQNTEYCSKCDEVISTLSIDPTGEHTHDNDCDAECNICGIVREVSGHIYDDNTDDACNECDYIRDLSVLVFGTCGDNINWELNTETKELTLTGTGATYNYVNAGNVNPFIEHRANIKTIIIGDGITRLGNRLFRGLTQAETVIFGKDVTTMGYEVFYSCGKLANVKLNEGLTHLGALTFYNCTKLTQIEITSTVTNLENRAFKGSGLTSVVVPNTVKTMGYEVFMNCANLAEVDFTEGVSMLNPRTFENCTSLKNFYFTDNMCRIRTRAFYGCTALESVTFEDAEEMWGSSNGNEAKIASDSFSGCNSTLKLIAEKGSHVEQYAQRRGFTFVKKQNL